MFASCCRAPRVVCRPVVILAMSGRSSASSIRDFSTGSSSPIKSAPPRSRSDGRPMSPNTTGAFLGSSVRESERSRSVLSWEPSPPFGLVKKSCASSRSTTMALCPFFRAAVRIGSKASAEGSDAVVSCFRRGAKPVYEKVRQVLPERFVIEPGRASVFGTDDGRGGRTNWPCCLPERDTPRVCSSRTDGAR